MRVVSYYKYMEHTARYATGTKVTFTDDCTLANEFPCLKGQVGIVSLSYSEPNAYTGERITLYSVKMPAAVFGGRSVRVSEYEVKAVA